MYRIIYKEIYKVSKRMKKMSGIFTVVSVIVFVISGFMQSPFSLFKEDRHGHLNRWTAFKNILGSDRFFPVARFTDFMKSKLKLPSTLLVNRFVFRLQSAVHTRSISMISNLKIIPISFVKTHHSQNSFHSLWRINSYF